MVKVSFVLLMSLVGSTKCLPRQNTLNNKQNDLCHYTLQNDSHACTLCCRPYRLEQYLGTLNVRCGLPKVTRAEIRFTSINENFWENSFVFFFYQIECTYALSKRNDFESPTSYYLLRTNVCVNKTNLISRSCPECIFLSFVAFIDLQLFPFYSWYFPEERSERREHMLNARALATWRWYTIKSPLLL